jgi:glutathione peroxidase-family protein
VVDPLGNVVLRFKPEINPTLILQDLKKLLKVSKVG